MAQPSESLNFDQLANRLKAVSKSATAQGDASPETMKLIAEMNLKTLEKETIQFGKTHLGKTFAEMKDEMDYMAFIVGKFKDSKKVVRLKFLRYIQLRVEQLEAAKMKPSQPKAKAKSQAYPMGTEPREDDQTPISSEEEWEHPPQPAEMPQQEMMAMHNRMAQLEVVMQQVLAHLTPKNET